MEMSREEFLAILKGLEPELNPAEVFVDGVVDLNILNHSIMVECKIPENFHVKKKKGSAHHRVHPFVIAKNMFYAALALEKPYAREGVWDLAAMKINSENRVYPGDSLTIRVTRKRIKGQAYHFFGEAFIADQSMLEVSLVTREV